MNEKEWLIKSGAWHENIERQISELEKKIEKILDEGMSITSAKNNYSLLEKQIAELRDTIELNYKVCGQLDNKRKGELNELKEQVIEWRDYMVKIRKIQKQETKEIYELKEHQNILHGKLNRYLQINAREYNELKEHQNNQYEEIEKQILRVDELKERVEGILKLPRPRREITKKNKIK